MGKKQNEEYPKSGAWEKAAAPVANLLFYLGGLSGNIRRRGGLKAVFRQNLDAHRQKRAEREACRKDLIGGFKKWQDEPRDENLFAFMDAYYAAQRKGVLTTKAARLIDHVPKDGKRKYTAYLSKQAAEQMAKVDRQVKRMSS